VSLAEGVNTGGIREFVCFLDGFFVVKMWFFDGETWCFDGRFSSSEKMSLF
jgi:hypothetical protein